MPAPANDNWAAAQNLATASGTLTANSTSATDQYDNAPFDEPTPLNGSGGTPYRSIWYKRTATADGVLVIDPRGTAFQAMVGVYTGASQATLVEVTSTQGYNWPDPPNAVLNVPVTNGVTYYIQIAAYNDDGGAVALRWDTYTAPPANDDWADATDVGSDGGTDTQTNVLATTEAGEPEPTTISAPVFQSVWRSWTPGFTGRARVSTRGSVVDTVLAVYTGNALASLVEIVSEDEDDVFAPQSQVEFDVVEGITYWIQVASYYEEVFDGSYTTPASGELILTWGPIPVLEPLVVKAKMGYLSPIETLALGKIVRAPRLGGIRLSDILSPAASGYTDRVTVEILDPSAPTVVEAALPESFARDFLDELNGPGSVGFHLKNEVLDPDAVDPYAVPMVPNPLLAIARKRKLARVSIDGEPVYQGFLETDKKHRIAKDSAARFTEFAGRGLDGWWGQCTVWPGTISLDGSGGIIRGGVPIQTQRRFDYTEGTYNMNAWPEAVNVARQDFEAPIGQRWIGNPPGWPEPQAFWIAPAGTHVDPDTGRVGRWYARSLFAVGLTGKYSVYYAGDDDFAVYLDGVLLADASGWEQLQKTEIPHMTAGFHTLATNVKNGATVTGILVCVVNDDTNEVVYSTFSGGGFRPTPAELEENPFAVGWNFWKVLPSPDHEPGMTAGHVLQILYVEAIARGTVPGLPTFELGFDGYTDSNGRPWPELNDITLNVGDSYDKVMQYMGESYCDYRWRPSGLVLDAYVAGTMRRLHTVGFQSGVDEDTDNIVTLDEDSQLATANVLTVQYTNGVVILTVDGYETDGPNADKRKEGFVSFDVDTEDEAVTLGRLLLDVSKDDPTAITVDLKTRSDDDFFYLNGARVGDDFPVDGDTERLTGLHFTQQDDGAKLIHFDTEFRSKWQEHAERLQAWLQRLAPGAAGGRSHLPSNASPNDPGKTVAQSRTYAFTFPDGQPASAGPIPADVSGYLRDVMVRRVGDIGTTTAVVKVNGSPVQTVSVTGGRTVAKLAIAPGAPVRPFVDEITVELTAGDTTRTVVTVIAELKQVP